MTVKTETVKLMMIVVMKKFILLRPVLKIEEATKGIPTVAERYLI